MDVRYPIVRRGALRDDRGVRDQERRERLVAARADGLTQVSPHLLSDDLEVTIVSATIPNGFEEQLAADRPERSSNRPRDVFVAYYGGRIYPAQDVRPFALACRILSESRPVRVEYAGQSAATFIAAFREAGAESLVLNLGVIPREESLRRARNADVVPVFSWNTSEKGILTGKVFELIAVNTPIAVIVAGEHRTSALAELFEGDVMRRVFGTATDEESVGELVDFLEFTAHLPNVVLREFAGADRYADYSHASLSRRLSDVIESLLETRTKGRQAAQ